MLLCVPLLHEFTAWLPLHNELSSIFLFLDTQKQLVSGCPFVLNAPDVVNHTGTGISEYDISASILTHVWQSNYNGKNSGEKVLCVGKLQRCIRPLKTAYLHPGRGKELIPCIPFAY